MPEIERNVFIVLLKVMSNSSRTLLSIIKVCSVLLRMATSLWIRPGLMTSPRFQTRKIAYLLNPYSDEEVRKAVFQMEHNKALGPDGFPAEFFQNFWDVIKLDQIGRAHV